MELLLPWGIEPSTIEKHADLALPLFEHILFFLKSLFFLLEAVPIIPDVSEQTFLIYFHDSLH